MDQIAIPPAAWFALIAIVFIEITLGWFRRRWALYQARRVDAHSKRAESRAAQILEREGFRVLARQAECRWPVTVNGIATSARLRADLIVERRSRVYVAEVKTGATAPSITCAETRRQLLEYFLAFDVDGILLVDMENERVSEIGFPCLAALERAA